MAAAVRRLMCRMGWGAGAGVGEAKRTRRRGAMGATGAAGGARPTLELWPRALPAGLWARADGCCIGSDAMPGSCGRLCTAVRCGAGRGGSVGGLGRTWARQPPERKRREWWRRADKTARIASLHRVRAAARTQHTGMARWLAPHARLEFPAIFCRDVPLASHRNLSPATWHTTRPEQQAAPATAGLRLVDSRESVVLSR